jgi:hypothetical protein
MLGEITGVVSWDGFSVGSCVILLIDSWFWAWLGAFGGICVGIREIRLAER